MLEVDSLQVRFNHRLVLGDVSFQLRQGEILGLLGRNGAGKSVLLKSISGHLQPDQMFLRIHNQVCLPSKKRESTISFLPQDNCIPDNFTVDKALKLSLDGFTILKVLQIEEIQNNLFVRVDNLSGGIRRYLEVILVLYSSADFVFLDEPFNGLSPIMIEKVATFIQQNPIQKGILITDHQHEIVRSICTKIALLNEGKLYVNPTHEDLIEKGYLLS